jgi:dihydrodipicolinate synthase/N-acetylneuraminate lyase
MASIPEIVIPGELLHIPRRQDLITDPLAGLEFSRKPTAYEIDSVMNALRGAGLPACVMPLTHDRNFAFDHMVNMFSLYRHAGFDGWAWLVHSTGFALHNDAGLFKEAARLGKEAMDLVDAHYADRMWKGVRVGGVLGKTEQALAEAQELRELGFHAALVGLKAFAADAKSEGFVDALVEHVRRVGEVMPVILFYLQEPILGFRIPEQFWAKAAQLECVVGVKAASFRPDETNFTVQAFIESGRDEAAVLIGDDDRMIHARTSPAWGWREGRRYGRVPDGDLLGHDSVDPYTSAKILSICQQVARNLEEGIPVPSKLVEFALLWDQWNGVLFDAKNDVKYEHCLGNMAAVLHSQGQYLDGDGIVLPGSPRLLPTPFCVSRAEESPADKAAAVMAERQKLRDVTIGGEPVMDDGAISKRWQEFAFR